MPDMVEVVIDSIRVSLMSPQRVVVLRQKDLERYLPIWVGPYEAEAITVALQEVELSRPLTHDLLKNLFGLFDAKVLRIEIVSLKEDIFYGNIVAQTGKKVINIDSRPSDAIALAVRAHVQMLVSQEVMDAAGIVPEKDIQGKGPIISEVPPPTREEEGSLDVYEDFLKKIKDEPDEDEGEEPKS
jgi:bifunctional DNase/RNase